MPRGRPPKAKSVPKKEKAQPARTATRKAASVKIQRVTRGRRKMEESEKQGTRKRKLDVEETDRAVEVANKKVKTTPSVVTKKVKTVPKVKSAGPPAPSADPKKVNSATSEAAPSAEPASSAVPKEQEERVRISHHSHGKLPGQVLVMGQGDTGQLGLGEDIMEKSKPSPVGGALAELRVVQVVCGGMHTAALTEDGKVFSWGCNDEGALGREVTDGDEYLPGQIPALKGVKVVQLSAGDSHTAALTDSGDVYCWGVFRDSNGPFGLVKAGTPSPTPQLVYSSPTCPAVKIASGNDHVVLLTRDSGVVTLGCAEQGQLGRVPEVFSSRGGRKGVQLLLQPQQVRFRRSRGHPPPRFCDVFCGSYDTFAVTEEGGVYAWGLNNYGQLGTDDTESRFQPERVPEDWMSEGVDQTDSVKENRGANKVGSFSSSSSSSSDEGLVITSGQHHTLLCNRGRVYVMGRREYGRLGLGEDCPDEPTTPRCLPGLDQVVGVAAGSACSFAVGGHGEVWSWGMGTNLQLGAGGEEDQWQPVKLTGKKLEEGGRQVVGVAAGGQHSALLVHTPPPAPAAAAASHKTRK